MSFLLFACGHTIALFVRSFFSPDLGKNSGLAHLGSQCRARTEIKMESSKKRLKTGAEASASSAAAGAKAPAPVAQAPAPVAYPPGPLPIMELLTTSFSEAHRKDFLSRWAAETKAYVDDSLVKFLRARSSQVSFPVPSQVLLFPPLEIKTTASGAKLSSFREVMNHENLMLSFSQSSQYEAAVESWKNSGLPGEGFRKFSGMKNSCDRFGLTCL